MIFLPCTVIMSSTWLVRSTTVSASRRCYRSRERWTPRLAAITVYATPIKRHKREIHCKAMKCHTVEQRPPARPNILDVRNSTYHINPSWPCTSNNTLFPTLQKNNFIQLPINPCIPWALTLFISLVCGTLSNAFARSKNITYTSIPLSTQSVTLSNKRST